MGRTAGAGQGRPKAEVGHPGFMAVAEALQARPRPRLLILCGLVVSLVSGSSRLADASIVRFSCVAAATEISLPVGAQDVARAQSQRFCRHGLCLTIEQVDDIDDSCDVLDKDNLAYDPSAKRWFDGATWSAVKHVPDARIFHARCEQDASSGPLYDVVVTPMSAEARAWLPWVRCTDLTLYAVFRIPDEELTAKPEQVDSTPPRSTVTRSMPGSSIAVTVLVASVCLATILGLATLRARRPAPQPPSLSTTGAVPRRWLWQTFRFIAVLVASSALVVGLVSMSSVATDAYTVWQGTRLKRAADEAQRQLELTRANRAWRELRLQIPLVNEAQRLQRLKTFIGDYPDNNRHLGAAKCMVSAWAAGRDPRACHKMVEVPAGKFIMGCLQSSEVNCRPGDPKGVILDLPAFRIDRTEVTEAEYRDCVRAKGCSPVPFLSDSRQPLGKATWMQANDYCRWANKRLPTEQEWEKAARGTDGRKYPWGNHPEPSCNMIVERGTYCYFKNRQGLIDMPPVGSRPHVTSPYGVLDILGSVAEYTNDWYLEDQWRVVRGLFDLHPVYLRNGVDPNENKGGEIGFRCAQSEAPIK